MKRADIAKSMARRTRMSPGEAADQLDLMVRNILLNVRRGREVPLPGLGTFKPASGGRLAFEPEGVGKRD